MFETIYNVISVIKTQVLQRIFFSHAVARDKRATPKTIGQSLCIPAKAKRDLGETGGCSLLSQYLTNRFGPVNGKA